MRKLRSLLAAVSIAAVLAVVGLTAATPPAGAFVTAADQCAAYFYGYQYWGEQVVIEYDRTGGEESLYGVFAYNRVVYYGHLFSINNC
jgi:hypothetical protein